MILAKRPSKTTLTAGEARGRTRALSLRTRWRPLTPRGLHATRTEIRPSRRRAWLLCSAFGLLPFTAAAYGWSQPTGRPVPSPDGKWSVLYSRRNGYGRLDLTETLTGRRYRMYRSNDSCCDTTSWVKPHLLIFVDDYNVKTLNPTTRRVSRIAGFSDFTVSHNGRWVAGYASSGDHAAETVGVVRIGGGGCRVVPHRPDQDDRSPVFSPDDKKLVILRRRFDLRNVTPIGPYHRVAVPLFALRPAKTC